jgi:hypothetical protein
MWQRESSVKQELEMVGKYIQTEESWKTNEHENWQKRLLRNTGTSHIIINILYV